MSRVVGFSHPLMLGFEELERMLDSATKFGNDGYPPYNIERLKTGPDEKGDLLRITLAVAGFSEDELDISIEDNQLTISGRQVDDKERVFLHRGIAARKFQRVFVLAEGIEVSGACIENGLLEIDLVRLQPERIVRKIAIKTK
ncbi:MAG: Hsp20 family protein [Pseudomonadota bacterium]